MKGEEPGEAPSQTWLQKLNKNGKSVNREGQKHQLPVRFESGTINQIERISKQNGFSKAETVRRLVSKGMEKLISKSQKEERGVFQ